MSKLFSFRWFLEVILSGIVLSIGLNFLGYYQNKKPKDMEKSDIPGIAMIWSKEKRLWAHENRKTLKLEEYQKYCGYRGEFCQFN